MPIYQRITINVSPEEDLRIKQAAKSKGISVSRFCREAILNSAEMPPDRMTMEQEIDKLAKVQDNVSKTVSNLLGSYVQNTKFMTMFMHQAVTEITDKETADKIWNISVHYAKNNK